MKVLSCMVIIDYKMFMSRGYWKIKVLDFIREIFDRSIGLQLKFLRDCHKNPDLCFTAATFCELECREKGCIKVG